MLVPAAMSGVVREVIIADGRSTDATLEVADVAGCNVVASSAPLAQRLREAAATARAPWLMFLRPGTVLDTTWLDETVNFIEETERGDAAVGGGVPQGGVARGPPIRVSEALALLKFALIGRAGPDQGLVISTPPLWRTRRPSRRRRRSRSRPPRAPRPAPHADAAQRSAPVDSRSRPTRLLSAIFDGISPTSLRAECSHKFHCILIGAKFFPAPPAA